MLEIDWAAFESKQWDNWYGYTAFLPAGVDASQALDRDALIESARLRIPEAINNLGVLYAKGEGGLEKNLRLAKEFFTHAANLELPIAMFNLGSILEEEGDFAGALAMCRRAAEKGDPKALTLLGIFHERGDYGQKASKTKAVRAFKAAARLGFPPAQYQLAVHYLGTPKRGKKAISLLKAATRKGHSQVYPPFVSPPLSYLPSPPF